MTTEGRLVALGDLAEITPGPSGSLMAKLGDESGGVPVVSPSDITDRHQVDPRKLRTLPYDDAVRLDRFILKHDDIVLVRQGSLGRLAFIDAQPDGWLYNSSCVRVRPHGSRALPKFLYYYLSSDGAQEEIRRRALRGTVQSLNSKILGGLPVVLPPLNRQRELVAVIADIDELVHVHRETADRLDLLRSTLLNDIMAEE